MNELEATIAEHERTIEELRRLLANARERWFEAVTARDKWRHLAGNLLECTNCDYCEKKYLEAVADE